MSRLVGQLVAGLVGIALLTTAVLPSHHTATAFDLASKIFDGSLATVMGKGS